MFFCPTLHHSDVFYSRQLASYNYCVYDGATGNADMIFWSEVVARRGVDEVCSAILKSLNGIQRLAPGQQRSMTFWSDRCVGQVNNWTFVCMMMYLIQEGFYTTVEQKFLCSGHSFLACDSAFALIEKRKGKCNVNTPQDWIPLIQSARPSQPFNVIQMTQADVKEWTNEFLCLPKPPSLLVTCVAAIRMDRNNLSQILTRSDHSPMNVWNCHFLAAPLETGRYDRRRRVIFQDLNFNPATKYSSPIELSDEKKRDLRKLMDYLPPHERAFYQPHLI